MKILVIDDTEIHRNSAIVLLAGHDVTVVRSLSEAESELMGCGSDMFAGPKDINPKGYEAVLTDLSLPFQTNDTRYVQHNGTPLPLGLSIAGMAMRGGVAKVAVVSAGGVSDGPGSDHHGHPYVKWSTEHFFEIPGRLRLFYGNSCPMTEILDEKVKDWKTVLEKMLGE